MWIILIIVTRYLVSLVTLRKYQCVWVGPIKLYGR